MDEEIRLLLLGAPVLEWRGKAINVSRRKVLALLAYLALTGHSHSRESLATTFWPNANASHARMSLRRVLSDLNKAIPATKQPLLELKSDNVRLHPEAGIWVDSLAVQRELAICKEHRHPVAYACAECAPHLAKVVDLFRGDFLAGFSLDDSPVFDEWQFFEAESLRRGLSAALEGLVGFSIETGTNDPDHYLPAVQLARRWVSIDPSSENPQATLMQLYALTGQSAAALRQFNEYTRRLSEEIGMEPGQRIVELSERIRRGEWAGKSAPAWLGGSRAGLAEKRAEAQDATSGAARNQHDAGMRASEPRTGPDGAKIEAASAAQDEIRLVSVLFVGLRQASSGQWEQSPEQTAFGAGRLLGIIREIAARYEAQVERFVGQGLPLVFGAPAGHEDDAERCLHAGLEIASQAALEGISISMGASMGKVFFGRLEQAATNPPEASPAITMVGAAFGEASLLQDQAAAGELLASGAIYRHTQRAFEFSRVDAGAEAGTRPSENTRHEAGDEVYRVLRALPHPEKARGIEGLQARLVGREEEMSKLLGLHRGLLAGQGGFVSLVGEAGIGKSRLIREWKARAWSSDTAAPGTAAPSTAAPVSALWLECRCLELRRAASYYPFLELINQALLRLSPVETSRARLLEQELSAMARRGDLTAGKENEVGAFLGSMLSITFENEWDLRLKNASPEQLLRGAFMAVFQYFTALARQQPLVLIFDDLHWADDLSLDLLFELLEAVNTHPILILCLYRQQQPLARRVAALAMQKCPARWVDLSLRELAPEQTTQLVCSLLGVARLPLGVDELILDEFVVKKSWGNPFFVEEAVRALIDQGALFRQDSEWRTRALGDVTAPESIQSLILSRVDRLPQALRKLLRSASVVGRIFPVQILAHLAADDPGLGKSLEQLEDAALIYRERTFPEVEYSFKHVLIQECVYETLTEQQRYELHRQVGQAMETVYAGRLGEYYEDLAFHYRRSQSTQKAIEYLIKSGQKARRVYLNDQAIEYFQAALNLRAPDTMGGADIHQLEALAGLGQIYHTLGQETQAERCLIQAIAVGRQVGLETRVLVRLYYWLGEVLHWQRRYSEQVHLGEAGLALLSEEEGSSVEAALMNQTIAIGYLGRGDERHFHELTGRTARFIRQLPYSEELRPAYVHVVLSLYNRQEVDQAAHWLEALETLAERNHDLLALSEVYDYHWGYAFQRGDLRQALAHAECILSLYARTGDRFRDWRCRRDLAWAWLMLGELATAGDYARQAFETAQSLKTAAFLAESRLILGIIQICNGDFEAAVLTLQEAAQINEGIHLSWTEWTAMYCLGQALLLSRRVPEARAQFEKALENYRPFHVPWGWWFNRWPVIDCILSRLETTCENPAEFEAVIQKRKTFKPLAQSIPGILRAPEMGANLLPSQWSLEPVEAPHQAEAKSEAILFPDHLLERDWTWQDPLDGSQARLNGGRLVIHAPNGRDLWHLNSGAPRLLRPVRGEICVEVTLGPVDGAQEEPVLGGLLLWKDAGNYLRLVHGLRGRGEISFEGLLAQSCLVIGRGLLPGNPPDTRIVLRLEGRAGQVRAFCRREGQAQWYSAGQVNLPVEGWERAWLAGVHAVGWIDRTIYPGAYPNGAKIQFEAFHLRQAG